MPTKWEKPAAKGKRIIGIKCAGAAAKCDQMPTNAAPSTPAESPI
jgi:hypothetical protein